MPLTVEPQSSPNNTSDKRPLLPSLSRTTASAKSFQTAFSESWGVGEMRVWGMGKQLTTASHLLGNRAVTRLAATTIHNVVRRTAAQPPLLPSEWWNMVEDILVTPTLESCYPSFSASHTQFTAGGVDGRGGCCMSAWTFCFCLETKRHEVDPRGLVISRKGGRRGPSEIVGPIRGLC